MDQNTIGKNRDQTMNNILVTTNFSFKEGLIQTYTLPYIRLMIKHLPTGSKVFMMTQEKHELVLDKAERKEKKRDLEAEGIIWLDLPYTPFGGKTALRWLSLFPKLIALIKKEKINTIHGWCTPGGMIGYILSKMTGRPLILDSFEPHAEAMVENGTWKKDGLPFRILFYFEKMQTKRAKAIISATEGMRDYAFKTYGVKITQPFFVKPACVDLELFSSKNKKNPALLKKLDLTDKIVAVYAGKFGGIYLDREVFDFIEKAYSYWDNDFRFLLLTNHSDEEIDALCASSNVPPSIVKRAFVMHHEIPDYIGLADFALTPVKPVPTKRYCTPIKDGEYWALGLPIVITKNISDDSEIIEQEKIGAVLKELTSSEYQKAIHTIDNLINSDSDGQLFDKIRNIAHQYRSFDRASEIYQTLYKG
jgi:glycosyltransferase involved in cell wall biosynthesis